MKNFLKNVCGFLIMVAVAILITWPLAHSEMVHAQDKPATPPPAAVAPTPEVLPVSELEQAQTDGILKDFQILQLKFANRIAEIKKAHNWGEDVLYDANQNKFYRLPKPEAKPKK